MDIGFLINGAESGAASGATYERHDPFTGKLATRAAAAGVADANAAVEAAATAFKTWSKTGPGERRALLMKAADVMASKVGEFTRLDDRGNRRYGGLGRLQRHAGVQHAARSRCDDHADHRRDHPGRQAQCPRDGHAPAGRRLPRHRAVECPGDPGYPRHRHADRLRQHGGAEGLGELPGRPSPDRPVPARGRHPGRRHQRHHQRPQGCGNGRRGADRAPGRASRQLHRLDRRGQADRRACRQAPQPGVARTRRQGAVHRAR